MTGVEPNSKGDEAGIQAGDFIKEINHQKIRDVADYKEAIQEVSSGDPLYMYLFRPQRGFVAVKLIK